MPKDNKNSGVYGFFRSLVFGTLYNPTSKVKDVYQINKDFYAQSSGKINLIYDLDANSWPIGTNLEVEDDPNSSLIDAVMLTNNIQQLYDPKKLYIIAVDDGLYELNDFSVQPLVNTGAVNVIAFNALGTGMSSDARRNPEGYQAALRSIINNLQNNDIPSGNIMIVGGSLPGAMATMVVDDYHTNNKKIGIVLKEENLLLNDVYRPFTSRFFRPLYRYLSSLFGLNIDATKSFDNFKADPDANAKILPKSQINDHLTELYEDRKKVLKPLDEKYKQLISQGKKMLEDAIKLIDKLQEKHSLDDISSKYEGIRVLNDSLELQNLELKKIIREVDSLVNAADKKDIISSHDKGGFRGLLSLSRDLVVQQQNLSSAVEKYRETGKTATKLMYINQRVENILTNGMYKNALNKQKAALESNRQQLQAEQQKFADQQQEIDEIIEKARDQLQKVQIKGPSY